jgi:acetyltransferase-like isoleucine patch superfamily enzyme
MQWRQQGRITGESTVIVLRSGRRQGKPRPHFCWGEPGLVEPLGFYVKSVICTAWFRLRRAQSSSWTFCTGRVPKLETSGKVSIGRRFTVRGRVLPCELGATRHGTLVIGDRVHINQGVVLVAQWDIEIGDDTLIGEFAAIYDSNYHPVDEDRPIKFAPVVIGKNVWIGRNVTVLPGSTIGDHTVVSAGSVVKGELPARVLAAGDPARPVRPVTASDGWRRSNVDGTHPVDRVGRRSAERTAAG